MIENKGIYNFNEIEQKWQQFWEKSKTFRAMDRGQGTGDREQGIGAGDREQQAGDRGQGTGV